jgi:hypothetical protein
MKKLSSLLFVLMVCLSYSKAQGLFTDPEIRSGFDVAPNPQLFHLNAEQYNHHFQYKLPDDGILKVDFLRLGDWGTDNKLTEIAAIAASQVALLKDSFKHNYTSKLLEINIPINKEVLSVNYSEDDNGKNQLAYKNGNYYQLKTGFDTIRIVKNISVKTKPLIDSGLVQIQYTFILKDINNIQLLKEQPAILEKAGQVTDAAIAAKRKEWSRQDAPFHRLSIYVDANNNDSIMVDKNHGSSMPYLASHLGVYMGFGAIVYNNAISPYGDFSIAYKIATRGKLQGYVGFNFTGFGYLTSTLTARSYNGAVYTTYNAEIGLCQKGYGFMSQRSSLVLGVMHIEGEKDLFNLGFNFGINRYLSVGFSEATNFKKADANRSVYGVHLSFNL